MKKRIAGKLQAAPVAPVKRPKRKARPWVDEWVAKMMHVATCKEVKLMTAEYTYNGAVKSMSIWSELREDGTAGPPKRFEIRERSCPSSPVKAVTLDLDRYDAERDVALYRILK